MGKGLSFITTVCLLVGTIFSAGQSDAGEDKGNGTPVVITLQDKKATNKEKLLGTWTPEDNQLIGVILSWEFTRLGKYKVTASMGGKELIDSEGTFVVVGDTIKLKSDFPQTTETWKIKTLTDKTLLVEIRKGEDNTRTAFKKK